MTYQPCPRVVPLWSVCGLRQVRGLVHLLVLLGLPACQNTQTTQKLAVAAPSASTHRQAPQAVEEVRLRGAFERVSKAVTGKAEIVQRGNQFFLRLSNVQVASKGPVRVYLVGHDRAASTYLVESTELKYDMAELEVDAQVQLIELPSEPDPRLRSVVLYHPTFGVNLGFAPLRAVFAP